ncbi:MAG: hypothetical protein AAB440_03140 [Patescibacteria group bacterium]
MSIGESAIRTTRFERRKETLNDAAEAARRISFRSLAVLRLIRIQSLRALRTIDSHAQQMLENQQRALKEEGHNLMQTWRAALAPKRVKETFVPLTGANLERSIDSKITDVHDHYIDSPKFLSMLAIALNDIEGYVDSDRDLTFRGWASVATQGIFRALESIDLEEQKDLTVYQEANAKLIKDAGDQLNQQLAWILDTYLRGRDSNTYHGFLRRSDPNIRIFSNLLLFLEFWDAHEKHEGAPVRLLSSERVQRILQASWEQIHQELLLVSESLYPHTPPKEPSVPLDEDEQRILVMRPEEKVHHILDMLRSTHWLVGSVESNETVPVTRVVFPEHIHHLMAQEILAESFVLDRLVGSAASDVYTLHIAPDKKAPKEPGLLPHELQHVLLDKNFDNLAALPLSALQTYCNDLALSGLLTSVVKGSYQDKKGVVHPFAFATGVTDRLRNYMATAGLARARALIDGFTPNARHILGLDSFVHTYQEEIPPENQTADGFILSAERVLKNIPQDDKRRAQYRDTHLPLIEKISRNTMSTEGAASLFHFVDSLVTLGLIENNQVKEFLTDRRKGVFKKFDTDLRKHLTQIASVDMLTAIKEFNVCIDSPLGSLVSHATRMSLARTLQRKLSTVLKTHGSYQALMFFGALEAELVRAPSPVLLTREVLREWLDAIEFDNYGQLTQTISRSDLG